MIVKQYKLSDHFSYITTDATVTAYIQEYQSELDISNRPAMIIFPGGSYRSCSFRDKEPVALAFSGRGYQSFVLNYTCGPQGGHFPQQLIEAAATLCLVKDHAEEWNIDKNRVFTMGFSAGGHLCGSIATMFNDKVVLDALGIEENKARPDAAILCYPVISSGKIAHRGSFDQLLGEENKDNAELLEYVSLEKRVTPETPPCYIWANFPDSAVPCENSLEFAKALKQNNVLFELHIYHSGWHGMSLANDLVYSNKEEGKNRPSIPPRISDWVDNADRFLHEVFHKIV